MLTLSIWSSFNWFYLLYWHFIVYCVNCYIEYYYMVLSPGLATLMAGLKVAWLRLRSRSARTLLSKSSVLLSSSTWMKLVLALTTTEADISTVCVLVSLSVMRLSRMNTSFLVIHTDQPSQLTNCNLLFYQHQLVVGLVKVRLGGMSAQIWWSDASSTSTSSTRTLQGWLRSRNLPSVILIHLMALNNQKLHSQHFML